MSCCSTPPSSTREVSDAATARLKALAHPVRLQIVSILADAREPVCACDVEAHFDLTQPTISHHLRVLREAGIIDGESRKPWVYFRLNTRSLEELTRLFQSLT